MAIPPGSLNVSIDFQNPACFTNGGTAITDLSGNGKNFTLSSTTYTFDNANGSITMPNGTTASSTPSNFLYGTLAFSMICWVKIETGLYQTNICRIGGDAFGSRFMPYSTATNDYFIMDGAGTAGAWNANITPGWHLLALTRPANCLCLDQKFYVDGVLIPFDAGSYNPNTAMNMNQAIFGELNDGYAGIGKPLTIGTFDLYTTEVSEADILTIYTNEVSRFVPTPPPPPAPALLAQYDFSDTASYPGSGIAVFDTSGNNYDLTLYNSPTLAGSGQQKTMNFVNTSNQYALSDGFITTAAVPITINIWLKSLDFISILQTVLNFGPGYPNPFAMIWSIYGPGSGYTFEMSNMAAQIDSLVTPSVSGFDNLIMSIGASSFTVYVNGVSIGTQSHTLTSWGPSAVIQLNGYPGGGTSRMGIYDIALVEFYDAGLDSTQVNDLYTTQEVRFAAPLPPVTGLSNGRRFGQGFPQ